MNEKRFCKFFFLFSILTLVVILFNWAFDIRELGTNIISSVILAKPWYFENGTIWAIKGETKPKLYPEDDDGDRILDQLMYIPQDYEGKITNLDPIGFSRYSSKS